MDSATLKDGMGKSRSAEPGSTEVVGNESVQLDSSLIFEVDLEDKLSSALGPLLSPQQESQKSRSSLLVPKSGSLRSLTKQLAAPENDGKPAPLSPVSKKKLSLQQSGLRCRSYSPGPIEARHHRRNRTSSPGSLARPGIGRTRLGGSPGPFTRRLEGRTHSPGALTRTTNESGRIQSRTASPGAFTRSSSGTDHLQRRTSSPGALRRTGVRGRIKGRNNSPGPLTRASTGTGRLRGSGSPGPLSPTSSGKERLLQERSLSPGPLLDDVPIVDEIDQPSISPGALGLKRSFRASRRFSLTRKVSSKQVLSTGPVSIMRRGKFSRAPEIPNMDQVDTGRTDRRQSFALKDLSMSRRKRVVFLLPDEASVGSSCAPEDSLQFGDLFMDDFDCEVEVQSERRGPNALRFVEQMDMEHSNGIEIGDCDGWRLSDGNGLEVVTERGSLSERESSGSIPLGSGSLKSSNGSLPVINGSLPLESHQGFQMPSGTTIQEEMGGQFGESFFGSIGSLLSDEESCHDSNEERKESLRALESRKKKNGKEMGLVASIGNASFSSSSLLTDESLDGSSDAMEGATPKADLSKKKAGKKDICNSKISLASLDLSEVAEEDKKDESMSSETSSESPTGVVDYVPVEG